MNRNGSPTGPPIDKRLVWVLLIVGAIPLIALNPWWNRRPGESIAEINAIALVFLIILVPWFLLTIPLLYYGKRRWGWGLTQYRWVTFGCGVVYFLPLMWTLVRSTMVGVIISIALLGTAVVIGIVLLWLLLKSSYHRSR